MNEKNIMIATKLIDDIKGIIQTSRAHAVRSVDLCRVQMYC